ARGCQVKRGVGLFVDLVEVIDCADEGVAGWVVLSDNGWYQVAAIEIFGDWAIIAIAARSFEARPRAGGRIAHAHRGAQHEGGGGGTGSFEVLNHRRG